MLCTEIVIYQDTSRLGACGSPNWASAIMWIYSWLVFEDCRKYPWSIAHQQKTFPSGRNGSVRVDALRQSHQRHPSGWLLRARRQYHASRCTSPSDRSFAVSSSDSARPFSDAPDSTCSYGGAFRTLRDLTIRIVKFWSSAGDLVPYSQSSGS